MNILYLTNHFDTGGISSYVLALAQGLKARGHNVYVACQEGVLLGRLAAEGIGYVAVPTRTKSELHFPRIAAGLARLRRFAKASDIHIAHSNTRVTQVLASLLERMTGVPHVHTCHGFFKKRLSRRLFPCWGQRVIAVSEAVKEHLEHDFGVPQEKIRVIHNGIDLERFRQRSPAFKSELKKSLGLGEGPVIGVIARLSDVKGHRYLIEAMPRLLQRFPAAQLLIVGEGKMKQELLRLVRTLGIGEKVFFMPSVSDASDILPVMDVFVLPSLKEGLGLSLMEAMAQGVSVVGSDVGGIKDLIDNGTNGLLVAPADPAGIAEAVCRLLGDAATRELFGSNAREFIRRNFPREKMSLETEKVYLECARISF